MALLLAALMSALPMWADIPFREHRFGALEAQACTPDDILFVGNSITDMFPWGEAFASDHVLNRGVSGALSGEVLQHIDNFVAGQPRKVFLMIGTNDLGSGIAPKTVADNIDRIVERIQTVSPRSEVYLQSILPSNVGTRTLDQEQETNELIKAIARDRNLNYIDLWDDLLPILDDPDISYDRLHATVEGYRIWCEKLEPYIGIRPNFVSRPVRNGGLAGSHGMRATYFSQMPVRPDDVLFFGDEMVKGGEWNELVHNAHILNRGSGWGYDGTSNSIAICRSLVEATLGETSVRPRAVILYTGCGNVNGDQPLRKVKAQYRALADVVRQHQPTEGIVLVSLLPTRDSNPRIQRFNRWLRRYASRTGVRYLDLGSSLDAATCFQGNYLNGKGYAEVARQIDSLL